MFAKPQGHAAPQRATLRENTTMSALGTLHSVHFSTTDLSVVAFFSVDILNDFNPRALPPWMLAVLHIY